MFEHRKEALISRAEFYRRLAGYGSVSVGFVFVSLTIGIMGYRFFEGMSWIDAFVNAAMILGGMGPVGELHTSAGKLFAGLYALYSGLVAIIAVGFFAAPIFHRFLHRFHLEVGEDETK